MTTVAPPARSGRAASSRSGPSTTPGGWAPRRPRAEGSGDERLSAYATVFGGQLANLVSAGGVRGTNERMDEAAAARRCWHGSRT